MSKQSRTAQYSATFRDLQSRLSARSFRLIKIRLDVLALLARINRLAGACALPADIICLLPTPVQVITGSRQQVVEKAENFALEVSSLSEEFESHFRDNRKSAVAHAWEIAYLANTNNERIAYEFALACLRARRSKMAQAILKNLAQREDASSKYVNSARRRVARQAWKTGRLDTAVKTLRLVHGRGVKSQYRSWIGILAVRNGLLLGESGDAESAEAVLMGGLITTGMDRDLARGVTAIYLKGSCWKPLDMLYSTMPSTQISGDSNKEMPMPIVLSGFGWSGSGAVADLLKGHPSVNDVFSGREIGLWTGRFGLSRLYTKFASKGFNRRQLLEFLARHCFGHIFLANSRHTKSFGGLWTKLNESQRWEFLGALGRWLEALQKWEQEPDNPLLEPFQELSTDILRLFIEQGGNRVLLSNCITSNAIAGIRMFRSPAVIVSWRNPGDAYASKKSAFPDNTLDLAGWRKQLMSRISRYLAGKKEVVGYARLWMDVSFEEFVQSDKLRQDLLSQLNLNDQQLKSTFDPSVSAKNIGILSVTSGKKKVGWNALASEVEKAREEARCLSAADKGCVK